MNIIKTNAQNPGFLELVSRLDAGLAITDGDDHTFYDQFNKLDDIKHVLLALEGDVPVACGAFKERNEVTVEIKRMYTSEACRGKGLATRILSELEDWAKESSYTRVILETGIRQIEALALYKKCGYQIIENYGPYVGVETSICFSKELT